MGVEDNPNIKKLFTEIVPLAWLMKSSANTRLDKLMFMSPSIPNSGKKIGIIPFCKLALELLIEKSPLKCLEILILIGFSSSENDAFKANCLSKSFETRNSHSIFCIYILFTNPSCALPRHSVPLVP